MNNKFQKNQIIKLSDNMPKIFFHSRILCSCVLVFCAFLTFETHNSGCVPAFAEQLKSTDSVNDSTWEVNGQVVDEQGNRVSEAEISLHCKTKNIQIKSDKNGLFNFLVKEPQILSGACLTGASPTGDLHAYLRIFPSDVKENHKTSFTLKLKPLHTIVVKVVDLQGSPIKDTKIGISPPLPSSKESSPLFTGPNGTAIIRIPADAPVHRIYGLKPNRGMDVIDFQTSRLTKQLVENGNPKLNLSNINNKASRINSQQIMVFSGARTVDVRVENSSGQPLKDVTIYPSEMYGGRSESLFYFLNAKRLPDFHAVTDVTGTAKFDWVPSVAIPTIIFTPFSKKFTPIENGVFDFNSEGTIVLKLKKN